MSDAVWLLTDAAADDHASPGHAERPARRTAVAQGVRDATMSIGVELAEPAVEPAADADVLEVHDAAYVELLDAAEERGGGWLDPDTYLVPGSMRAARLAAGATIQAARAVLGGEAAVAFAVMRPPGHHASADRGAGFCLLNNVAIAAAAMRREGVRRIAILDWDVHHGDGTQAIFESDPDLCYASTHGWPLYPGTGSAAERGSGAALGTKHNRPVPAGSGDEAFVAAWRDELLPAVEEFGPEAILVSVGYDAHRDDPLGNLLVGEAGFGSVAHLTGELAARLGLGGVALTLEGGYDLGALRASAAETVRGLLSVRHAATRRA